MSGSLSANNASMLVSSGAAGIFPIGCGYVPPEGSRVVSAQYLWSALAAAPYVFTEDLSQVVSRGELSSIQSVYVDNSSCSFNVTMLIEGTQQTIVFPAYSAGYYPIFFTGTPKFSIASPGNQNNAVTVEQTVTRLAFLNIPFEATVWPTVQNTSMASQRANNFSATATLKSGPGRLFTVTVQVVTAVAAIQFQDSGAPFLTIPIGTNPGTVYNVNWPFVANCVANFGGATGNISASWS